MAIEIIGFGTTALTDKMKSSDIYHLVGLHTYADEQELEKASDIFQSVEQGLHVTTSQPSTNEIMEAVKPLIARNSDVIIVTPTELMSGTHQNAVLALQMLEETYDFNYRIIKSYSMAMMEAALTEKIMSLIEQDLTLEEVFEQTKEYGLGSKALILPNTFTYLKLGGRINLTTEKIGNLFKVKLMLIFEEGTGENGITFTMGRSFKKIYSEIERISKEQNYKRFYVTHVDKGNEKFLEGFKEIAEKLGIEVIVFDGYPSVVAAHFGPGTVGILGISEEDM